MAQQTGDSPISEAQRPSACAPWRRFAAMLYDGLLLLAVWMLATFPVIAIIGHEVTVGNPLFRIYLVAIALAYLHLGWNMQGATLGMRSWRIRLEHGPAPWTLVRSARRLLAGTLGLTVFGLGYLSMLWRHDRRSWSDRFSDSSLVDTRPQQSTTQQQPTDQ
ncbi:MAG: RDD family protein [Wenzhouxiangellaceae bacterium]|nr:RDD family protein [Wenzhouxiangellaceae bacterium]